jgi:predicted RecA/RadA family phage recombinase
MRNYVNDDCLATRLATAVLAAGAMIQDYDGKAGLVAGLNAVAIGDTYTLQKEGVVELDKTASIVLLAGGRAYWDRANSKVTFKRVTGGFYIGTVQADAASADATVLVNLNKYPINRIQWDDDIWTTVLVGAATAAKDAAGNRTKLAVIATNEAEKSDALSNEVIAIADGPILEARFTLVANGSDATVDINFGLANGTNATDADAITEHVFFHVDGASQVINAQSKDGTTTVAAVTTTISAVDGTFQEFWIDARDPANVKLYIDGVRVLSGSTFKLNAGTGPMKALVHIEKTTGTATGSVGVEFLNVRSTDLL